MAIVAVMMVIGFSAFKLAETSTEEAVLKGCAVKFANDDRILFYFNPSVPPTKANVENLTNWIHSSDPEINCDETDELACGLLVDPEFVDDSTTPIKLDPSINLVAKTQANPADSTYVESIANNAGDIFNKSM